MKGRAFFDESIRLLRRARDEEGPNIERAADLIYGALRAGHDLYAFGTGHGHLLAEEIFYRAGGLVRVRPVLDEGLMLHRSASRSTELERTPGYAARLLADYPLGAGDVMLIASNSGRNAAVVEMALEARARGARVIALTNRAHSESVAARHESGYKLYQIADVVLDNGGCVGDACVSIGTRTVSPTSTVVGAALLQAIVAEVVERDRGGEIESYRSSNVEGGDAWNERYIRRYRGEIRSL